MEGPVQDQMRSSTHKSVNGIGRVARDLDHPWGMESMTMVFSQIESEGIEVVSRFLKKSPSSLRFDRRPRILVAAIRVSKPKRMGGIPKKSGGDAC